MYVGGGGRENKTGSAGEDSLSDLKVRRQQSVPSDSSGRKEKEKDLHGREQGLGWGGGILHKMFKL